jgi:hypothetical protein
MAATFGTSNNNIAIKPPASGDDKIGALSSNNSTRDHSNATDDNSNSNSSTNSNHDEDHSAMHHDDKSSHSMSMMSQGTVMYMDGFRSALFHNSQTPPPCLNFLHPTVSRRCARIYVQ